MIKTRRNGIDAMFGTGDIHMFSGIDFENKKGFLYLENHEPMEIGEAPNGYVYEKLNGIDNPSTDIFPCTMSFTDTRSIDALIAQLNITKEYMTNKTQNDFAEGVMMIDIAENHLTENK